MKLKKNWNDLMEIVRIMHNTGYTTMMNNHKRWEIFNNDNSFLNGLPIYNDEVRGNKSPYSKETNLDVFHEIIQEFVIWSLLNIEPYEDFISEEIINFHEEIKMYCE
jgi:hypothetical protein